MIIPRNQLSVEVYDSTISVTPLNDPEWPVSFSGLNFRKFYPGGVYGDGSFFAPRDVYRSWLVRGGKKLIIRNGHEVAWEGALAGQNHVVSANERGVLVPLMGITDRLIGSPARRRRWCDNRMSEDVWEWDTAASASEKCGIDRNARLRFTPKNVSWAGGEYAQVKYEAAFSDTVKRLRASYQLQEGAQAWKIEIYRSTDGSAWTLEYTVATASGTSTFDRAISTPTKYIALRFASDSGGAQTPASDGTIFGEFYNILVDYNASARCTMEQIAKDLTGEAMINGELRFIQSAGANTLYLEPFLSDQYPSLADIMNKAVDFGDAASPPNRWAWGAYSSEEATTPDGTPVLFLEPYPLINTGEYDYIVNMGDPNVMSEVSIVKDYSQIVNYTPANYRDAQGIERWITPADYPALANTPSSDEYYYWTVPGGIDGGDSTAALTANFGGAIVNFYKNPPLRLDQPLELRDYILDKFGLEVDVSLAQPGKRLLLNGWIDPDTGDSPIIVITGIDYSHDTKSARFATGAPSGPFLSPWKSIEMASAWIPGASGFDGGGGEGGVSGEIDRLNWKREYDLPEEMWEEAKSWSFAQKQTWIKKSKKSQKWAKEKRKKKRR